MIEIETRYYAEIKPCPFCASDDVEVYENRRSFNGQKDEIDYYIGCEDCDIWLGNDFNYDQWGDVVCDFLTKEEAIKAWNNRPLNK